MGEERYVAIPPRYFTAAGSGIDLALLRRPRAVAAVRKRAFSLPPSSRIRQRIFGRLLTVAFDTYARGDYTTVPKHFYAPDCEVHAGVRLDLPKIAVGRVEIARWVEIWHEPFTSVRWRALELFDGGDVAYFAMEMTAVGRASGAEITGPTYSALRIEDAFVSWQFTSLDRDEALEAAGFA